MSNDSNEVLYKKYKLEGRLDSKKLFKEKHPDTEYKGTIADAFKKQFNVSDNDYERYVKKYCNSDEKHSEIQKIKSKFTGERKGWPDGVVAFYDWYKGKGQACGYCGISQDELYKLFSKDNNKKLPLNNAVKRSFGTLEIERRDSETNEYNPENCILACPLCNNAKSNLIDEENWMSLFAEPMREYYKKLLGKDLKNEKPEKLAAKPLN
ncbi:MAG: hypothetical protein Q9M19_02620 [Mariprofundaceae bacterium]|nr:hypothetical protein [Mariprofundaceae bacterium]